MFSKICGKQKMLKNRCKNCRWIEYYDSRSGRTKSTTENPYGPCRKTRLMFAELSENADIFTERMNFNNQKRTRMQQFLFAPFQHE